MTKNSLKWLALATLFQVAILAGMWVKAGIPLWTGSEIRLETKPVDPRSLFRGNYARLSYDINDVSDNDIKQSLNTYQLRQGEVVYRKLVKGDDGIYTKGSLVLKQPEEGIFIRGRLDKSRSHHRIKYGIQAFFAPKEKALALERQLRDGAIAVIKVTRSGQAGLLRIEPKL
ncbi:hypothetical protein EOPP23_08570 [Endozoicomonas sp. OPT23]|uniref:GDYXXLXY domain-containing protein n=1 Tax=Endozoicomonas sp. OPT23 TaxID=2072845 RepID=UPI00129A7C22|nr:GDYXXLXY domain-containing protein [Endozoicomonas sp. OPT23]MRI33035.1 hypothetical protein [Endozoicomonas sp. OPT23]